MLYRILRAFVGFALRVFYRLHLTEAAAARLAPERLAGPLIFVGNHPNGLVDPGLIFAVSPRQLTFLAKEPLFRMPVIGTLLRRLGALPVYRKQDDPGQMQKNEGSLTAAIEALQRGGAIALFPEGKSHSEPQLSELKTGCARIALRAAAGGGKAPAIVPIGFTYGEKHRFRSEVHVDLGEPIDVAPYAERFAAAAGNGDAEHAVARELTARIATGLREVTLNLDAWEDLPLIRTAEALYAVGTRSEPNQPERLRAFAKGLELLRDEQPMRFAALRHELLSLQRRLDLVEGRAGDLATRYSPGKVLRFALRNLAAVLFGVPLFLAGVALYWLPYQVPRLVLKARPVDLDLEATVKVLHLLVLAPLWWLLLSGAAFWLFGGPWGLAVALLSIPHALFTLTFFERRTAAWRDARVFFVLGLRQRLKAGLLAEGEQFATRVEALAEELGPRLSTTTSAPPAAMAGEPR